MIIELAPKEMHGLMMGIWYFATAMATVLAGTFSKWTVTPGTNLPIFTSPYYVHTFTVLGVLSVVAAILLFIITPFLKKAIGYSASHKLNQVFATA